ncbi:receptor-type tyrosine-protein phosphatase C-like [Homarus americanus]|uniref:receptor-type tyrosine-protein phosphatase C-like n=1 Tax=Homarus americanus TaxID=6706 RepID=UPI001C43BE82|nr:receptor-type tyrosine-protein phosphatase C-like [Homarus americanus]
MTANHSRDNVEDEVKQLLSGTGEEEKRIHARNTRQARACEISLWVAGLVDKEDSQFEIGDGKTHGGYYNCPLKFQESYYLGMMAVTELLGKRSFAWTVLTTSERVVPFTRKGLYWIPILIVLLLIVIAVAVVACYMYWRRPARLESLGFFRKGNSNNGLHSGNETSADSDSTHPTPLSPAVHFSSKKNTSLESCTFQSTEKLSISEPTYENLATEEIYGNLTARVPRENVEAYLNMTIRSRDVSEEFKSVSYNYNKTTEAGQLLPNKHKNRYKNNLPNDDTRVILSTINDDPYSDYINANHVPGYGRMQYIASQGPKDANVSTIADFWRMIMEQKITAIIMVANFIEGGRNKVGEYFKPGVTLEFDGYYVSVIHREQLPLFTVSTLQVKKDDYSLDVKHYHYVSWPDHGIPDEAHSMAHMIKHFRSNVSQVGGTVVHCSAGIGRTGTTLQVLHMCEMLTLEGSFNPIEVLRNLRNSRARLVENEAQYNLSLEIFEEVLFGDKTKVTPSDLVNSLDSCLEESVAQFRKIKNLPSPVTYKTSNPSFRSMVRNKSVLPADSRRIYLHMINGQPETQYINAVWIPGLNQQRAVIVTEHPLPATLPKFWRLVAEEKCPFVILINQFDKHSKEEFPDVMPAEGEKQTFGKLTVHVQEAQPYGNNLIQYIVNITESETIKLRVKVYQVLSWMFGQDEPPTPNILVILAELLLESRGGHSGSPLLCCGNGVTSCGLVTAMSLLLEQLQNEQLVDVYRTVVKLLRSRPQFITSEAQYALLYRGVAEYIKNYSTYGNFQ